MKHIFLTGQRHIGKSTLIREALKRTGAKYCGLVTFAVPQTGPNKVVYMQRAGEEETKSECGVVKDGKKICRDYVFDKLGVSYLNVSEEARIVVIDEIGSMEENAKLYSRAVLNLLRRNDIMVLGSIQNDCRTNLGKTILSMPNIELLEVTESNRVSLLDEITSTILGQCALHGLK